MAKNAHGLRGSRIHGVFVAMHSRCHNPSNPYYRFYGAKGIFVCERWNNIELFLADMGHPRPDESLDRIDGNKGYSPGNCRWATQELQNENVSRNKFIAWNGEEKIIKHWARDLDLDPRRVSERLRRGWSVERALSTPTPLGFSEARRQYTAAAKALWAERGRLYVRNSQSKAFWPDSLPSGGVTSLNAKPSREAPLRVCRPHRKVTPEISAQIIQLASEGFTCREIAAEAGVSKSSVSLWLQKHRLDCLDSALGAA